MPDFDVVELEPPANPDVGEEAPDFTRPLVSREFWADRSLTSLLEDDERVVVVFTPMIGSFVCQYVWDELAERGWDERGVRIVGVTASTPYSISGFLEERDLPFEIVADPANGVAEKYGIAHDLDDMAGIAEPRLAFFTIDSDRRVEAAWVATEWPEFPDYDDLEAMLGLE
ncbi:redoxin domain-containing protein [Natrialbaceae archaeon A-CW1-1]